jgi:probable F420-dependent oxidoreductase
MWRMKFGVFAVNQDSGEERDGAIKSALLAEELGFESLWATDHVVVPTRYDSVYPYSESGSMGNDVGDAFPDPLVWLAFAAAATHRIRLATGVLVLPQRNPVVLAKQAATLDRLSGGRLTLGVGTGWLAEEFAAVGVEFARRGRRHDDYLTAMRELWTAQPATVHTEHVDFSAVISRPRPVQPSIPIVIGGSGPRSVRRAALLGDGLFPAGLSVDAVEATIALLREETERAGRDQDAVPVTVQDAAQELDTFSKAVERYEAMGVERILVSARGEDDLRKLAEGLSERFGMAE